MTRWQRVFFFFDAALSPGNGPMSSAQCRVPIWRMGAVSVLVAKVVVVDVTVDNVPVVELVVVVGTGEVEGAGSAAVVVATGAATMVVDAVVVVVALVEVVLVGAGATMIVPLFLVDDVLFRRVRS